MKYAIPLFIAQGLALVLIAGLNHAEAVEDKQKLSAPEPVPTRAYSGSPSRSVESNPALDRWPSKTPTKPPTVTLPPSRPPLSYKASPVINNTTVVRSTSERPPMPSLSTHPITPGHFEKVAPSGAVRERAITGPNGDQKVEQISATGRVEKETLRQPDGTVRATSFDLGHREKKVEVSHTDGTRESTNVHYNRNGEVAARETVKLDARGAAVSKTVVVKNNLLINNSTVVRESHREYVQSRFGYVYRPVIISPMLYNGWYDPYWYGPPVALGGPIIALTTHSFTFSWGWFDAPWYGYYRAYWAPYPIYVNPSYWMTDWLLASYLADRYATQLSVEQTREEVRLAREEADKAKETAEQAQDQAEIAEARGVAAAAEVRAERAEARAAKAETDEARRRQLAGQPGPNAKSIDQDTKESLKAQIEQTIAQKRAFAEQSGQGERPVLTDVSRALADPSHIFVISKTLSVISASDLNPAGLLSSGDLLRLEPGQETVWKDGKATDFVTMRVLTSKGDVDEVAAGALVKIALRDLQEFENEFEAKLDLGLLEADRNQAEFKRLAHLQ